MKNYYCITLALLLVVLIPIAMSANTPSCDQTLVKEINDFWDGAGIPQNVLKMLETNGDYVVVDTVNNVQNGDNKCIQMTGSASKNMLSFVYTPKDQNGKDVSVSFDDATENNGIISSAKTGQQIYNIIANDNIIVGYICSAKSGDSGTPQGFIAVNPKSWSDSCTQASLLNCQGMMNLLGFKFPYTYGDECFQ